MIRELHHDKQEPRRKWRTSLSISRVLYMEASGDVDHSDADFCTRKDSLRGAEKIPQETAAIVDGAEMQEAHKLNYLHVWKTLYAARVE